MLLSTLCGLSVCFLLSVYTVYSVCLFATFNLSAICCLSVCYLLYVFYLSALRLLYVCLTVCMYALCLTVCCMSAWLSVFCLPAWYIWCLYVIRLSAVYLLPVCLLSFFQLSLLSVCFLFAICMTAICCLSTLCRCLCAVCLMPVVYLSATQLSAVCLHFVRCLYYLSVCYLLSALYLSAICLYSVGCLPSNCLLSVCRISAACNKIVKIDYREHSTNAFSIYSYTFVRPCKIIINTIYTLFEKNMTLVTVTTYYTVSSPFNVYKSADIHLHTHLKQYLPPCVIQKSVKCRRVNTPFKICLQPTSIFLNFLFFFYLKFTLFLQFNLFYYISYFSPSRNNFLLKVFTFTEGVRKFSWFSWITVKSIQNGGIKTLE